MRQVMDKSIEKTGNSVIGLRGLSKILSGVNTSDGDGVRLTRLIGSPQLNMLDPFLLLDCFESDQTQDYIGGFPTHPHRGFETVTYLLNGRMRHKDNAGHEGVIEPGGVQWMTAGKGILHSEMPEQQEGLMKGFQLWVNLPRDAKMTAPKYQEFSPDSVPVEQWEDGTNIRVIAGKTNHGTSGLIVNDYSDPTYMDITIAANSQFEQLIPSTYNGFIYVIEGSILVQYENGEKTTATTVETGHLGILADGEMVSIKNGNKSSRFLLIAGRPFDEPVARGGPFVMNTKAEILQAFDDYNQGRF